MIPIYGRALANGTRAALNTKETSCDEGGHTRSSSAELQTRPSSRPILIWGLIMGIVFLFYDSNLISQWLEGLHRHPNRQHLEIVSVA